jgi:predicted AAA+ superfamily ATPase
MTNLDEVIDRLRELVEELEETSEGGRWYVVEDAIEELEDVINDLWGLSIRCRCNSRELGSPETPPRRGTVLGNTVRGGKQ